MGSDAPGSAPQRPGGSRAVGGNELPDWTPEQRETFLDKLRATGNVSLSARSVGASRSGAYHIKGNDKGFENEWTEALAEATDALHEEARRRAVEGVEEPVFYQGVICGGVLKFSDSLLMSLLKAHDPRFREKVALDHTTSGDGLKLSSTHTLDMTVYTAEEREMFKVMAHRQLEKPKKELDS